MHQQKEQQQQQLKSMLAQSIGVGGKQAITAPSCSSEGELRLLQERINIQKNLRSSEW